MKNIVVIGAGTMGNGIAQCFAQYNYEVILVDISDKNLQKAKQTIETNLDRMIAKETINVSDKTNTIAHLHFKNEMENAIQKADLVIEAVSENIEIKLKIFKQISDLAPENCLLATNTSSISITKIASVTKKPENVIGMHFMNPVPLMKLVEVIRGFNTSDETTDSIMELSKKIGKTPVEVNDYPGFVSNRILMPMLNEAIFTLYENVAGVEEIDTVMKLGMAHPMGPLQLADFIGLDVCLSILNVLYDGFKNTKYAACPLLVNMVAAGKLGVKSGEGFYDYSETKKAEKISKQF